jgi:hypothetical protein
MEPLGYNVSQVRRRGPKLGAKRGFKGAKAKIGYATVEEDLK